MRGKETFWARGTAFAVIGVLFASAVAGCATQNSLKTAEDYNQLPVPNALNFTNPDYQKLTRAIEIYNRAHAAAVFTSELFFAQQKFREVFERNSNNEYGEIASYYIGRIYFDVKDYYDAQVTFNNHLAMYPETRYEVQIEEMMVVIDDEIAQYNEWLDSLNREAMVP